MHLPGGFGKVRFTLNCLQYVKIPKHLPLLLIAGLLASCDTPQKRGLRELAKRGIQPSGEALLEAVGKQDSELIGWLVDVGVFTEQCDDRGRTPMRVALENQNVPAVYKLLAAKANVNAATTDHVSVLGIAVEYGEPAIIGKLVEAGASAEGLMPDGEKILPWAIREGRLSFVRSMMEAGADPHLKDRLGSPLIHVAMEAKRHELTEALIELGADPKARNAAGETTLHLAFRNGWLDLVPVLAEAGAEPDAPGVDGSCLLERAVSAGNVEEVDLLLKVGADPNQRYPTRKDPSALEQAFAAGNAELFQVFLDRGAKPASGSWDSWLWKALDNRDAASARILISNGASARSDRRNGLNPVEAASLAGDGSFVKLLMDYHFPPGNALYHCAAAGDLEMVNLLVACGAPVDQTRVPSMDTPLAAAIRCKRDDVAAFLVRNGADLDLAIPENQQLLALAIVKGCRRTVEELLAVGTDPNTALKVPANAGFIRAVRLGVVRWLLKNDSNITPLMLAADSGDIQITRSLMKAGAKSSVWTKTNHIWPINFASRRNDVKMMRLFLGRDPAREDRRIEIRLSEQRARVFDSEGKEIFSTRVSTGKKGHATPTGEFVITNKYRAWKSTLYHDASMPYFQRFSCGDFGMHEGNVPNYPASHGCIRLPAGTAKKLFAMTQSGDRVNILP